MLGLSAGSLMGGHTLTISGTGFSGSLGMTEVSICDLPCRLTSEASAALLECDTSTFWLHAAPSSFHDILAVMPHQVKGTGTPADQSANPASKMFDGQVGIEHEWRFVPNFVLSGHHALIILV